MSDYKSKILQKYIKALSDDGMRLLISAFGSADFNKNKTQNLRDSYGSAVYYQGKLVKGTERYLASRATRGKYNPYTEEIEYGRNEIKSFFANYKPDSDGLVLIIAVAMYYGDILENQKGGLKRKYRVISGISSEMKDLAKKYKGTVRDINIL